MNDDLDGLKASLTESANGFRPDLDATALAAAGTRAHRRRLALGGVAGAAALAVVATFAVPLLFPPGDVVPAAPVSSPVQTASPTPSDTPSASTKAYAPIETGVSTDGWKTFSSKEYPITFSYPSDWTVTSDSGGTGLGKHDGCDTQGCVLFVSPPEGDTTAAIELIREPSSIDAGVLGRVLSDDGAVSVLGVVPDLQAWSTSEDPFAGQALVATTRSEWGTDYQLVTGWEPMQTSQLAVGSENPLTTKPEARFSFGTNVGNIGGKYPGNARDVITTILASALTNLNFDPTLPKDNGSGRKTIDSFDTMKTPVPGAVVPDSSWKTLEVKDANLSVRYPSRWKVVHTIKKIWWIEAPSGYIIDLLVTGTHEACDAGAMEGSELIGSADGPVGDSPTGSGPMEIRWTNGGEIPVRVALAFAAPTHACFQRYVSYGGTGYVYLGSADNSANPTAKELDEAVAILASAQRLG